MATQTLKCDRHGEATRLTCVDCAKPICPKCFVRTAVGLKCDPCSQPAAPAPAITARPSRRPMLFVLAGLAVIIVAVVLLLRPPEVVQPRQTPLPPVGQWTSAGDLGTIRGTTTAVTLDDGRVLVAGGGVGAIPLAAALLYEPQAGEWRPTAGLGQARRGHQAVLLADGRVLLAGGFAGGDVLASTEIYDPETESWSRTADMTVPRLGHSLTTLGDGRVLAAGGTGPGGAGSPGGGQTLRPQDSAEIFDPATGQWSPVASMGSPRFEHSATLLDDGRILVAGGLGPAQGDGLVPLASTELYDPAADAFVQSNPLSEARANHAAALLPDRSVLVVGGSGGERGDRSLASAERFHPRSGSWVAVGPLSEARTGLTATPLEDGRILAAGGEAAHLGSRRSLASAELFDPGTSEWRSAGEMACPRSEHTAVLLEGGSVLVLAGDAAFPGQAPTAQSCADLYEPQ